MQGTQAMQNLQNAQMHYENSQMIQNVDDNLFARLQRYQQLQSKSTLQDLQKARAQAASNPFFESMRTELTVSTTTSTMTEETTQKNESLWSKLAARLLG